MKKPILIVIVGPTAVGKTSTAISIAKQFKTEIISADSRQFYKEMNIGTAVPGSDELNQIKHHFIQSHSVEAPLSAGEYEKQAIPLIEELLKTHNYLVLTGGSGLYIDAIVNGIDTTLPEANPEIRNKLENQLQSKGIQSLQEELKKLDENFYKEVDLSNSRRLIRALEICISTGRPYSELRKQEVKTRSFNTVLICLNRERTELYARINERVDLMMGQGLLVEAKALLNKSHLTSLNTVGYSELFDYLNKKITLEEAVSLIKRNSRRYAKRQITWFKRNPNYHWFQPDEISKIAELIQSQKII